MNEGVPGDHVRLARGNFQFPAFGCRPFLQKLRTLKRRDRKNGRGVRRGNR